jgi:hypothetical protein
LTNSNSRPASGWNGCVTRTRDKPLRSGGLGAFDESIQRVTGGLNSLVKAAKRRARGYRTNRNYIAMIYLAVGKLNAGPAIA